MATSSRIGRGGVLAVMGLLVLLALGARAWADTDVVRKPPTGAVTIDKVFVGDVALTSDATIRVRCEQVPEFGVGVFDELVTIPAGTSEVQLTLTDIPAPSDCVVSEEDEGDTIAVDVEDVGLPVEFRLNPNEDYQLAVANQVTTLTGRLEVRKVSLGKAAGERGDVVAEVVCTDPSGRTSTEVVTLGPGRVVVGSVGDIVAGSTCTVTELDDGAPDGVDVTTDGSPRTVEITQDGTSRVTITNTYAPATGTVLLSKEITGPAAADRGDVSVSLVCDGEVVGSLGIPTPLGAGTFPLPPVEVAAGSTCTVIEPQNGATADASVTVSVDPATVEVTADTDVSITVTNTYEAPPTEPVVVDVEVSKVLTGDVGRQGPVLVVVDCDGGRRGAILLATGATSGGTVTVGDVDAAATCTITEPFSGANDAVTVETTGTTEPGGLAATGGPYTVTNDYASQPGAVRVTKEVAGAAAAERGSVTIEITCDDDSATSVTFAPDDPLTDVALSGVTDGATCTVTESEDGATTAVGVVTEGAPAEVDVVAGAEASVTVRNTYTARTGALVAFVALRGNAEPFRDDVAVTVDCDGRSPVSIDAVAGERPSPLVVRGLAYGTTCDLTQTADGDTPDIDVATLPSASQSVTIARPVTLAGVIDTYTAEPGSLTVVKELAGDSAARDTVTIQAACDSLTSTTTFEPDEPAPLSFTVGGLLPGESCTVTELEDGGSARLAVSSTLSPSGAVVVDPGGDETVTVTNTYTAELAVVGLRAAPIGALALGLLGLGLATLAVGRRTGRRQTRAH